MNVQGLRKAGYEVEGFPADAANPEAVSLAVQKVRAALGPIHVLLWNAYGLGAGDLTTATPQEFRGVLEVPTVGFLAAVQAARPISSGSRTQPCS